MRLHEGRLVPRWLVKPIVTYAKARIESVSNALGDAKGTKRPRRLVPPEIRYVQYTLRQGVLPKRGLSTLCG